MIKFTVYNRFSAAVQFVAKIDCKKDAHLQAKRGLAVKWAVESGANLSGANLSSADLSGANLSGADLSGAYLSDTPEGRLVLARTRIIPSEGEIIGWKKCKNGVLVKLRVPAGAKRSHAFGRKCRAEFVDVLDVIGAEAGTSQRDDKTRYQKGARVTCDKWNNDWREECAGGIHFFITREEAEAY